MMKDKHTMLYVDDEKLNIQLFEMNFERKYTVYTAISALDGLELLRSNPDIDIVISDMKMPVMNGIEFIKKAKAEYANIKFFILTGFEINDEIQLAIDDGLIVDYFSKPFKITDLEDSIHEVLNPDAGL